MLLEKGVAYYLKKKVVLFVLVMLLASCSNPIEKGKIKKVGLLVPETINDQVWGTKGYKGILNIQNNFNVDVYYREGIESDYAIKQAVQELSQKGVNLIFGHGAEYANTFNEIANKYPNIHFVSFNGEAKKRIQQALNLKDMRWAFSAG